MMMTLKWEELGRQSEGMGLILRGMDKMVSGKAPLAGNLKK